jgi:hypothetical protein
LGNPFGPERLRRDAVQDKSVKVEIVLAAEESWASTSKSTKFPR